MTIHPDAAKPGTPVILGIPFDANSSWLRGAAGAPPIIRVAFNSNSWNSWTETGVDLSPQGTYCDAGDLKFTFEEPFAAIEKRVGELLDKGLRPVCLGGDHSITLPIVRAFGRAFQV
jgi:arginase